MPGKYFVIAYMRDKSPIVSDVIELLEGKDTECALREPNASLKVTLKRAGKPAANESVHVFSLAGFKDPLKDEYDPNRGSVFGNYNVMPRVTGEDGVVETRRLDADAPEPGLRARLPRYRLALGRRPDRDVQQPLW